MGRFIGFKKYWAGGKEGILKGCDPAIRAVVADLNDAGYYTVDSCSGHKGDPNPWFRDQGQIFFVRRYAKDEGIKRILRKHGLKNIRREPAASAVHVVYVFDPVGEGKHQHF